MNKESFEKKLYIPRNSEGEPNQRTLEIIRELEEKFEQNPAFIGIVPRGSTVHGYSTERSDIDLLILFDSSKITPDKDDNSFTYEYHMMGVQFFYLSINSDHVLHDIELNPDKDGVPIQTLAALTEITTGDKINIYRDKFNAKLNDLPAEAREKIRKRVVDLLMDKEIYSTGKATKRIEELNGTKDELLKRRRELWEHRFDQVWPNQNE